MSEALSWVGFLRAVNVGRRTVTKEQLCALLDTPELGTVSTFLTSGNVILRGAAGPGPNLEAKVEAALLAGLGYVVETFVRSSEELDELVLRPVFRPEEGVAVQVGFVRRALDADALSALAPLAGPQDQLQARGRELWWRREGLLSASPLATAAMGKALGQPVTLRTLRTVERIAARLEA